MVNRFIINIEIDVELIFIVYAVLHLSRWDHDGGFVYM
jgi:hypothetical protein